MQEEKDTKEKSITAFTKEFGKRLKELRGELLDSEGNPLTQSHVAELTGLNQNVIYRLETGRGTTLDKILTYLNFLDSKGFNIAWILMFSNFNIDKYKPQASQGFLSTFIDKATFMQKNQEHLDYISQTSKELEISLKKSTELIATIGEKSTEILKSK